MNKRNVLIADNVPMIHRLVTTHLSTEPLTFYSAYDGQQTLDLSRKIIPDLLLLDVDMPKPNGLEVCRALKADPKTSGIAIIFLTAETNTAQKVKGWELGAFDYVTKPFEPTELRARVRAALRIKELIDLLSDQAMIDGLTGLRNRAYFDDRLSREIASAGRHKTALSCVMVDVDNFKQFNDRYGHAVGDEALRHAGRIFREGVRLEDTVCRYGGEEFVALLPHTSLAQAVVVAERIRAQLEASPLPHQGGDLKITASFGVADILSAGQESLVTVADRALYSAKKDGRNRVHPPPSTAAKPAAAAPDQKAA